MYLKRLYLENIRCFRSLSLDFGIKDDVRRFVLLLGDNGVGKTTILRCIAMGLCDETSASGLLSELGGDIIRAGCERGVIEVELWEPGQTSPLVIRKEFNSTASSEPDVRQTMPSESVPWHKIFACGYGIARVSIGADIHSKYKLIESVYTLFNYTSSSLWSPEIALNRLERAGVKVDDLLRRIERILILPEGSIVLDRSGISVSGPWGGPLPLGSLGDGYSATFGWITDVISWALQFYGESFDTNFSGIVLVDMIERDLHPLWQRRVVSRLRKELPAIQFIATTHAPMCAIGTTDLEDEECELIILNLENGESKATEDQKPPRHQRVDQVLTSYLFGLPSTGDDEIRDAIDQYAIATSKAEHGPLNDEEKQELARLEAFLEENLGRPESDLELHVTAAVKQALKNYAGEAFAKSSKSERILEFEALNRLRSLVGTSEQ